MSCKEEFIEIFKEKITRPGADALLNYLENKSDFFTAPASARYHMACEGGLCEHSLNVYHCLVDYLQRERVQELYGLEYSEETVAVVALLHDVCKVGCYKKGFRNVKNDATGQWERVPSYTFDDPLPYGHGEKSVYIVNGFIRLSRMGQWPSAGIWASPAPRTPARWVRPSKNTPWPSPWPPPTWKPATFWKRTSRGGLWPPRAASIVRPVLLPA